MTIACNRRGHSGIARCVMSDVMNVMNVCIHKAQYDDFIFPPKRDDRRNGFLRGRVPDYHLLTWVDIESQQRPRRRRAAAAAAAAVAGKGDRRHRAKMSD